MARRAVPNTDFEHDLITGNYHVRRHRVFAPFPFSERWNLTRGPGMLERARVGMARVHPRYEAERQRRADAGLPRVVRSNALADFSATVGLINFVDDFLALIGFSGDPLATAVQDIIEFFADINFPEFIREDVPDALASYFRCAIPENFDGTELYSPWCILLAPEHMFELFQPVPNSVFPMQIPWLDRLIADNCTTVFNGNDNLLEFEFSDNCGDGQPRPFCGDLFSCDYCERGYRSCGTAVCLLPSGEFVSDVDLCDLLGGTPTDDAHCFPPGEFLPITPEQQCERLGGEFQSGVGDILDTLLYLLAIIPRAADAFTGISGGISINTIEQVELAVLGLIFIWLAIPIVTWPVYLLAVGLLSIPLWTLVEAFATDDGTTLPVGLLILIGVGIAAWFFANLPFFFQVVFSVLAVIGVVWAVTLFVDIPSVSESVNLIQGLIDFFEWLDHFPLLWFINFGPLLARLEEFNFAPGEPIPDILTFCVLWNFGNIGALVFVFFFAPFLARIAGLVAAAVLLFIFEFLLVVFFGLRGFLFWRTRRNVARLRRQRVRDRNLIAALQKRIDEIAARIGVPPPSAALPFGALADVVLPMPDDSVFVELPDEPDVVEMEPAAGWRLLGVPARAAAQARSMPRTFVDNFRAWQTDWFPPDDTDDYKDD